MLLRSTRIPIRRPPRTGPAPSQRPPRPANPMSAPLLVSLAGAPPALLRVVGREVRVLEEAAVRAAGPPVEVISPVLKLQMLRVSSWLSVLLLGLPQIQPTHFPLPLSIFHPLSPLLYMVLQLAWIAMIAIEDAPSGVPLPKRRQRRCTHPPPLLRQLGVLIRVWSWFLLHRIRTAIAIVGISVLTAHRQVVPTFPGVLR